MTQDKSWEEFEPFLKPISQTQTCGADLRYEQIYDQIREARRQEDPSLPQGVWKRELKYANWGEVEKLCTQVLLTRSKDLQIAAWLAEAWLHEKGITGFAHGVWLMHALSEAFWDHIYPGIDEDGIESRLAPIDWLNEKLPDQIDLYPVAYPDRDGLRRYTLAEYEFLQRGDSFEGTPSRPLNKEESLSLSGLKQSVQATPDYYYEVLYKDTLDAIEVLEKFESYLTNVVPGHRISLYQLRMALGRFRDFCLSILSERELLTPKGKIDNDDISRYDEVEETMPKMTTPNLTDLQVHSKLTSREQAYALLADIAVYLEVIEPHSPTPYLLKKAISWGNMPLSHLLQEFIQNNMDFQQLQRWLGIPSPGTIEDTKHVANQEK